MKVDIHTEIIEKLSARGIVAYLAVVCIPEFSDDMPVGPLAEYVKVKEVVMEEGLRELRALQISDPAVFSVIHQPKPKTKKKVESASVFALPEWIDKEAWDGFEEMRNKIKKPMTDRARKMIVSALYNFQSNGENPNLILNQSTVNCWQDVYALKRDNGFGKPVQPKLKETEFKL